MSLTLWNDELQAVVDMSAYQLCDKYGKDTEATNSAVMYVTPLDLESKTDENTTPVNTVKSIATTSGANDAKKKRPAEDDYGSESSNGKKAKMVEVKIEKDA
ncbi:hypothetical protein Tco_1538217 [Tanacetum coccineum]